MPPNNEISSIRFDLLSLEVEMCHNTDGEQNNKAENNAKGTEEHHLFSSPVSVTNCLDLPDSAVGAVATDSIGIASPYTDGSFEVQRSARRRRIKRGCLASNSGEYRTHHVAYRIFRPELLRRDDHAPLVVLHGGPSMPSSYLYPLVDQVRDRSIIFYDQLGCGRSDAPNDLNSYSIESSVDDLEVLLRSLRIRRFHLHGHSFGGMLAYEYVKRAAERSQYEQSVADDTIEQTCASVIISNASTNFELSNMESNNMLEDIRQDLATQDTSVINEAFWKINQCRLDETPFVLQNAIDNAGVQWHDSPQLATYVAKSTSRWAQPLPPTLIIRGTHDFVTKKCTDGWARLFKHNKVCEKEVDGSHYLHLEQPKQYGELLGSFLREQDLSILPVLP